MTPRFAETVQRVHLARYPLRAPLTGQQIHRRRQQHRVVVQDRVQGSAQSLGLRIVVVRREPVAEAEKPTHERSAPRSEQSHVLPGPDPQHDRFRFVLKNQRLGRHGEQRPVGRMHRVTDILADIWPDIDERYPRGVRLLPDGSSAKEAHQDRLRLGRLGLNGLGAATVTLTAPWRRPKPRT